jgi:flagellar hook-associated protein FlgK
MPGLLGTLNLGARSLQTQQQGVAVAGHNLANANNPAYARQVLEIQTSTPLPTSIGSVGTGADAVAITQVRDTLLDQQVQVEASITGSLQSQQTALQTLASSFRAPAPAAITPPTSARPGRWTAI